MDVLNSQVCSKHNTIQIEMERGESLPHKQTEILNNTEHLPLSSWGVEGGKMDGEQGSTRARQNLFRM